MAVQNFDNFRIDFNFLLTIEEAISKTPLIMKINIAKVKVKSQSVFVRARENPKHKQTAQRRLLIIIYINKISNAISVTSCLSSG